jgi:outer membrane protein OmpA-like peptidoglycan-associated protein
LVRGLPKNATGVQVEITGVSVSLATLDENLALAQTRAKKVANYLKKQDVTGKYTVTVIASVTVDGAVRTSLQ